MRYLLAALAALAVLALAGPAVSPADASPRPIQIPAGGPNDTGAELPPYNCGGCSLPHPNPDSDGDGLRNYTESMFGSLINGRRVKTDPMDPDTDGDGLLDGYEANTPHQETRNYGAGKLRTRLDPTKWDTDADGHSDGLEVKYTKTEPNTWDTDRDRLGDGEEGFRYRTNALRADTDRDCVNDGAEVRAGTDPLRANLSILVRCRPLPRVVLVR
jgi:hypothetical protein